MASVQFVPPLVPDTSDPDFTVIQETVVTAIEASESAPDPEPADSAAGDGATDEPAPLADTGGEPSEPDPDAAPEEPVAVEEVCSYG